MTTLRAFAFLILIAGLIAGCESSTSPPARLLLSEGNDILVTGNKAIVLANGSNSLYIVDLSNVAASDRELLVLNEGNFGKTNSTLDEVLFHKSGASFDSIIGLSVLPDSTQRLLTTIPLGLDGPNKMALIGANLLLVTCRNTTSAVIVDLTKNAVVDSISIGEPVVAVAVLNNKAYITSGTYNPPGHLNVVDLATNKIVQRTWLRNTPEQCVVDSAHNQILIGTAGDYDTIPPVIYFVNSTTNAIADSLVVGDPTSDGEVTIGTKHFLIVAGNVYSLSAPTHTLPNPLINGSTTFYKGFYDATWDELYLAEYNFSSPTGKVDVFNGTTGTAKWSFTTGIAPGHFAFYH